jgi:NADPH-dependent 2,4-dienoyl-CoA reductase/sulfur reductase-like enzyme
VTPATEALASSGLDVADGVVVNEYLETNLGDILAAGDVASYQDTLFGKRRRVEHWDNAVSQAEHCARALMGDRKPFQHVPYFFSDVFDLSYEFWGDPSEADQVVHRGDLAGGSFSAWWLNRQRLSPAILGEPQRAIADAGGRTHGRSIEPPVSPSAQARSLMFTKSTPALRRAYPVSRR